MIYNHRKVEEKWNKKWKETGLNKVDINEAKSKFYNLWMFPYPSAEGLHAGHAFASTGSDIYGRFMRMSGKNVFQPIGYDSFGIHSENFALKIGQSPSQMLKRTTKNYETQLRSLGHMYDWERTVTTSDINYYKWTQWLFLKMFEKGLAYKKKASVNFCPSCKTVLADEQVMTPKQAGKEPVDKNGKPVEETEDTRVCERCGTLVEKKVLSQWFFKITEYADRLLDGLENIDWSQKVIIAQREWIGKKEGAEITYKIKGKNEAITCFTTRPDTNFGATFIVVSPEYAQANLVSIVPKSNKSSVSKYIKASLAKTEQQRKEGGKEKTGEFTGLYATNKLNNYELPVYVSDFVLSDVGTGAVVGVPGHDKRDFEFAYKFDLPIVRVVSNGKDKGKIEKIEDVFEGEGKAVNSGFLDGLETYAANQKVIKYLEEHKIGKKKTNYHLRDWLVSRQRYWGAPIPMIDCKKCGWQPVEEKDLPVALPEIKDFKPEGTGKGPLANHPEFYKTKCPKCGGEATRETDVMDTFVDSSWYFLRYPTVGLENANKEAFDPEITKKWLPVDLYFGGAEHSVLHLMYARFVTMVLKDMKYIDFEEPFPRFFAHGLMIKDGAKMSKSRGNVVNPDEYVEKYGADTLRLYLMFMGPMDGYPDFRDSGIEGMGRFIKRILKVFETKKISKNTEIKLHQTIKKVTKDIQNFRYNTAISSIMELINEVLDDKKDAKKDVDSKETLISLAKLLAPFTPYLSEELWERLDQKGSIHTSIWPKYNKESVEEEEKEIAIQINGKLRSSILVKTEDFDNKEKIIKMAKDDENVKKHLDSKKIVNEIFVPGKIVNFVVR